MKNQQANQEAFHELKRAQVRFLSELGWKAYAVVKDMGPILWYPPQKFILDNSDERYYHTEDAIDRTSLCCKDEWYDSEDKICVDNNLVPAANKGNL